MQVKEPPRGSTYYAANWRQRQLRIAFGRVPHGVLVSKVSKGLQLTLQLSELVAIEQCKDKLSQKCGEIS